MACVIDSQTHILINFLCDLFFMLE